MLDEIIGEKLQSPALNISVDWLRVSLREFLKRPDNLEEVIKNLEDYRRDWIRNAFVQMKDFT